MTKIAVLGAGNWGTTLAHLFGANGHDVALWSRSAEICASLNRDHANPRAVPGLAIATSVVATPDLRGALEGAGLVVIVIPAQSFRAVCRALGDVLVPEQLVVHATKGLEIGTRRRMSEVLAEETCARQIGVLSGPNIAAEIASGKPAGTVVASAFPRVVAEVRRALASNRMLVFSGEDVAGVELAGALKNVVALAAGMAGEMAIGENAKALLITRGLAEITRLSVAMGARQATFAGLAGIGDLMVTCASPLSRNHRVGAALARGEGLQSILDGLGMVAEGVPTAIAARELAAQHRLDSPLLERVHRVLYEALSPRDALEQLMRLPAGKDVSDAASPRDR